MKIGEYDWRSGNVEHWCLGAITTEKPLGDHYRWDLREDLALVRFPGEVCLDVGWYPEGCFDGHFAVQVIVDKDWCKPLFRYDCTTVKDLVTAMSDAIKFADRVSSEKLLSEGC